MSHEFALEALISDLTYALEHARQAGMDLHFVSEISHLITTANHNKGVKK